MTKRKALTVRQSYLVGYAKPPKAGQFTKGISGNRAGRPKGSRNVATLLSEALHDTILVTNNGVRRPISKLELSFRQLANQGASGDLKAIAMILKEVEKTVNRAEPERAEDNLDAHDQEVAQALITRIRNSSQ